MLLPLIIILSACVQRQRLGIRCGIDKRQSQQQRRQQQQARREQRQGRTEMDARLVFLSLSLTLTESHAHTVTLDARQRAASSGRA